MSKTKAIGGLSPNEVRTLAYLRKYIGAKTYAPSYEEICAAIGLKSKSGIGAIMDRLEDEGLIDRVEDRKRAVKITAAGMGIKLPKAQA